MAREFAAHGVGFVFVYTREAHPGECFPAHRTLEQKIEHARAFRDRFGIERPILVDDLGGTGHRLYGELPNMTYLVSRSGQILFRSDWTDPPTIEHALRYVVASRERRREGLRLKPFYTEMLGYRWSDQDAFNAGLEIAGPQAVADFASAMQRWNAPGTQIPGRIAPLEE
jgi:hypothetical protein